MSIFKRGKGILETFNKSIGTIMSQTINKSLKEKKTKTHIVIAEMRGMIRPRHPVKKKYTS